MGKIAWKGHWTRRSIQIIFFFFVFFIVLTHFLERRGSHFPWPVGGNFHGICPFGAVETVGTLIMNGNLVPKIYQSNFWVLSGVMLVTILLGSVFCGYLCPLGSIQEWIGSLGRRMFRRFNHSINQRLDRALGFLRYGVLALILIKTTLAFSLVFQRIDPYYALFHFWMGDVFPSALIVLGSVVLLSLFFERPWCRWLCPFGALLGLVQIVAFWKIRRTTSTCTGCGRCSRACPMKISLHKKNSIFDTRCNRCGSCIEACRHSKAISFSGPGGAFFALRSRLAIGVLALALFFSPILYAQSGGFFKSQKGFHSLRGRREALTIQDIKGTMTLADVAEGLCLQTVTLAGILGIPSETPVSTKMYDLEEIDERLTIKYVKDLLADADYLKNDDI